MKKRKINKTFQIRSTVNANEACPGYLLQQYRRFLRENPRGFPILRSRVNLTYLYLKWYDLISFPDMISGTYISSYQLQSFGLVKWKIYVLETKCKKTVL